MAANSVDRYDGKVLDFGGHLHPSATPDDGTFGYIEDTEGPIYRDMEAAHQRYQASGMSGAVFSQSRFMGLADVEETERANDELLSVIEPYDEYYALAALPTVASGEAAAAELERCLDEGYHGGAVETKSDGIELTDEALEPVFEVADRTGAPLMVHPKISDSLHPDAFEDGYLLNNVFGREAAICASIWKVIHDGILDRYPDLTLVFHHLGGNIASMIGRAEGQLKESRRELPKKLKPFESFRDQLEDRIYVDSSGYEGHPAALRAAFELFPASNVLFGSDFPYETRTEAEFRQIIDGIRTVAEPDVADAVLYQNTIDLLVNVD